MINNNFIWADLSTYDLSIAKQFYHNIFNWKYEEVEEEYLLARIADREITGLYETPTNFKEMNMPSFWMSYIQVDNIREAVNRAEQLGGIIELRELVYPVGKFALIRDTLGAGFTIYEGNQLNTRTNNQPNTCIWNELFVSDFDRVKEFYTQLFNWSLKQENTNRHIILNDLYEPISAITEVSNDIKGSHEYWAVYFGVAQIDKSIELIIKNNGKLVYKEGKSALMSDPFGAVFYIIEV